MALGQRQQALRVERHSLLALGHCSVGGSVIGELHCADRADLPGLDQDSRAAGLVCAFAWSKCCWSWWRDLTPSLRNALRRW